MALYITDYTGDPANLGTNFAYGDGSSALPADLSETIDNRVAALLRVGAGLTKTYDDVGNTLTIGATAVAPPGIKTLGSVYANLKIEPTDVTTIYCRNYWPNAGLGGVFDWDNASTVEVDNGRFFEGSTAGRWIRRGWQDTVPTPQWYGAIADGENFIGALNGEFNYGGVVYRAEVAISSQATNRLLSSYISNLGLASSWYRRARVGSLSESLNYAAIQSCIEHNAIIRIPRGIYWINRSLEFMRQRIIKGDGDCTTVIYGEGISKFKPRRKTIGGTAGSDFFYCPYFELSDIWLADNNSATTTTAAPPSEVYAASKSNFYWPGTGNLAGGDGTPNGYNIRFNQVQTSNSWGDGIHVKETFTTRFVNCTARHCLGYGLTTLGANTTSIEGGYFEQSRLGGIQVDASIYCSHVNSIDSFQDASHVPFLVLGKDSVPSASTFAELHSCNLEGSASLIIAYGVASIHMVGGTLQHMARNVNDVAIEFRHDGGSFWYSGVKVYNIAIPPSTLALIPNNLVKFLNAGVQGAVMYGGGDLINWGCYNSAGLNTYGEGTFFPPIQIKGGITDYAKPGLNISRLYSARPLLSKTTNFTIDDWQSDFLVNATAGNILILMPYNVVKQELSIYRADNTTNTVTFRFYSGETQISPAGFSGVPGFGSVKIKSIAVTQSIVVV